jgi:hypothetical protein
MFRANICPSSGAQDLDFYNIWYNILWCGMQGFPSVLFGTTCTSVSVFCKWYGQKFARNMLSWSWRSIKLLLLHLVGVPYLLYLIKVCFECISYISCSFWGPTEWSTADICSGLTGSTNLFLEQKDHVLFLQDQIRPSHRPSRTPCTVHIIYSKQTENKNPRVVIGLDTHVGLNVATRLRCIPRQMLVWCVVSVLAPM